MGKGWDSFGARCNSNAQRDRDAANQGPGAGLGNQPFGYSGSALPKDRKQRAQFIAFLAERMAECLRIAKPGAHALVWALPRTSHWTATALEDAGWIVEDRITHHFGQGFPKHKSKLKPATEDWWLCTKPGGAKWLGVDGCRVESATPVRATAGAIGGYGGSDTGHYVKGTGRQYQMNGRWPTNAVFSHHPDCVPCGTKRVKVAYSQPTVGLGRDTIYRNGDGVSNVSRVGRPVGYADADGMEVVEAWQCVPGCPVLELDAQSGEREIGKFPNAHKRGLGYGGAVSEAKGSGWTSIGDSGGASRFFPTFAWGDDDKDDLRAFYYCGKATRRDRDEGCGDLPERACGTMEDDSYAWEGEIARGRRPRQASRSNFHPTIKPTPLMRWLCRLVTPPGGTILDPFLGSGSTLKAAKLEGFGGIGIDLSSDYLAIARRRIAHAQPALAGLV